MNRFSANSIMRRTASRPLSRSKRRTSGNLEDQQGLWKLLHPKEIGVHLTDGMMMDPEASVSALVFHHPDGAYFSVAAERAAD